ncbi:MAG: hypothetical protein HZB68_04760 [Candidatus Aenigmarchaeota archaeon]|nr:hypothetical protein [Candidatus Aenigmarchaeota archaeon]
MSLSGSQIVSFEIDDPKAKQAVNREKLSVAMLPKSTSPYGSDTEYFEEAIKGLLETNAYDIIVAPEYNLVPREGPVTREDKDSMVERLLEYSRGKDTLLFPGTVVWKDESGLMKNTIPVISNGEVVFEYSKMHDGGEVNLAKYHNLTASYGSVPGRFSWKGYDFGLEVCRDHFMATLTASNAKSVDFHVIVSCGMDVWFDNVVSKELGYVMMCDGYQEKGVVARMEQGMLPNFISSSQQAV